MPTEKPGPGDGPRGRSSREYKDSVIRLLFEDKERALELCRALTGREYPPGTEVRLCDPEKSLLRRRGDIAFAVGGEILVVAEHMSAPNPNLALRLLQYVSEMIFALFVGHRDLFKTRKALIPAPRIFVLYNGERPHPETVRLSESYAAECGQPSLELAAQVIDANHGSGSEALKRSPSLAGYAYLVALVRQGIGAGLPRDRAIAEAVKQCIEEGILEGFLRENYGKVAEMLSYEYSIEDEFKAREEDAMEKGIEKGIETMLAAAFRNLFPGDVIETMRREAGISKSQLAELKARALSVQPE